MSTSTATEPLHVAPDSADDPGPVVDLTTEPAEVLDAPSSARPTFTITDAASSCSVSRKTITRKLPELAIHGAAKDDDGVWRIPVEALLAVGLHPGRSLPQVAPVAARTAMPAPLPARDPQQDTITIPRDRWDDVRIRLARAEAEAAERALALADARLALRALTAGPAPGRALDPGSRRDVPGAIPVPASTGLVPVSPDGFPGHPGAQADVASPSHPEPATGGAGEVPGEPFPGGNLVPPPVVVAPEMSASVPADVVAARNLAARTGGYVPAGSVPVRKRRWWQSR